MDPTAPQAETPQEVLEELMRECRLSENRREGYRRRLWVAVLGEVVFAVRVLESE